MARGRGGYGFTLIEMMISIAILAIVFAISVSSLFQFGGLNREREYAKSLVQAQEQLSELRKASFDRLPPEFIRVGEGGLVKLSQKNLVDGSVRVLQGDGTTELVPDSVSLQDGTLSLSSLKPGTQVLVDYEFHLADRSEPHFVAEDGTVSLENTPVLGVDSVFLAKGDSLTATSKYKLKGNRVKLDGVSPGQLVLVDYRGKQSGNIVSGRYLDKELQTSQRPTDCKMLTIGESYRGPMRSSLCLLKVRS